MTYRRTLTWTGPTLSVVEEYSDDETPSLPPMPVIDTTGFDVTDAKPLAKCPAEPIRKRQRA